MHNDGVCELSITSLSSMGEGVGRLPDGRVVFVAGALPGDEVRVKVVREEKGHLSAQTLSVLVSSPDRVISPCTVSACDVCPLKSYRFAAQAQHKREHVLGNLRRIGHLAPPAAVAAVVQEGDGWHYRHRARLHAAWTGARFELGYFARHSHHLVPFAHCPILWPELAGLAAELNDRMGTWPKEVEPEYVELAYSRRDGRGAAKISAPGRVPAPDDVTDVDLQYDHAQAEEFSLRFSPGVFTQASPAVNDALVAQVLRSLLHHPRILELHSGIGNFTIPLARAGHRITAVEQSPLAAVLCRHNLAKAGVLGEVKNCGDARALGDLGKFDAVLLDPPRTGAKEVATVLAQNGPPLVAYVSCDSATLARDAAVLVQGGYDLLELHFFDMFAQTAHVETLALFGRDRREAG